jgi:hypothetical protein
VVADRLWLLGTGAFHPDWSGALVSLNLTDGSRHVYFEKGVFDITKVGDSLWALRRSSSKKHEFLISAWKNGAFEDSETFTSSDRDQPLAFWNRSGTTTVLSWKTIRVSSGHSMWRTVRVKGKFQGGAPGAVASCSDDTGLYVGSDRGEWGGGLQRVDMRTGVVTNIERRDTKELCAGPLNQDCDPVPSVIPDPLNRHCILAAAARNHMMTAGGVLRVCGERVDVVFEKAETMPSFRKNETVEMTAAFYGLTPAADGSFWAVASSPALYHFRSDGTAEQKYELPELKPFSGIYLSRNIPGVIVLRTDLASDAETGGDSTFVIPLDSPGP